MCGMYLRNHVQCTAAIIIALCECNAINQVSVEWSHPWILSTDSKDKTSLQDLNHSAVVVTLC